MIFDRLIRALLPHEDKFFNLLEAGSVNLAHGARLLKEFGALGPGAERTDKAKEIKLIESKGDEINRATIEALIKSFVTPIEREDIIALATCIDDVLDAIDFASNRAILYDIGDLGDHMRGMIDLTCQAVEHIQRAMHLLRHHNRYDEIRHVCRDIHNLETQCDAHYHQALASMFRESTSPLEVIKFKELYEDLEGAMDMCDDAGKVLANVVIRNG